MHLPRVSIVLLNYNGLKHLQQFLPSVCATVYGNYEVVLADNASTDLSVDWVRTHYPVVKIIINSTNEGFAGGYNWALPQVNADYYVLLNTDVEVTSDWLQPIIACMEEDKQIAACQPKILSYHNKGLFEYAGAAGGWIDYLGYPFSRGRIFDVCEEDKGQYNNLSEIFWASGAALFIRSSVFHEQGGFENAFFAHQEEIDLCWRIQLAGYKIMACPRSIVYHVGGGTLPRGGKKVYLNFRNNLMMLYRNLPVVEKCWKLPVRFALDAISAWKALIQGEGSFFVAIFKAHVSFLGWVINGVAKAPVKQKKSMIKLKGVSKYSLIWQYYIGGKRKFNEIINQKNI